MNRRIGSIVFALMIISGLHAQIDRYETWAEATIGHRLSKNQNLDFTIENRSSATSLTGSRQYFNLGYKNKTIKRVSLISDLRYAIKPSSISELRLGIGAQYSFPLTKNLDLDVRSIWQSERQRDASESEPSYQFTHEWRNRVELDFAWNKKIKTSLGSELFYDVSKSRLDRWRTTLSQKTRLTKGHWISLGLGFQKRNLFRKSEENQLIYRFGYDLSI